jgi:hypothetical protein
MKRYKIIAILIVLAALVLYMSGRNRLPKKIKYACSVVSRFSVTTDNHPWKIVESVYGLGDSYLIVDEVTQKRRQAVAYIASGAVSGLVKKDKYGAYFAAKAGGKEGEFHRNEFLADFLAAGTDVLTSFVTESGDTPNLNDFTRRAMITTEPSAFSPNDALITGPDGNELGWTLMAFSKANQLTSAWVNINGNNVTIEDLLRVSLSRPVNWGSYSGLIEQLGIAAALREYKIYKLNEEITSYDAEKKKGKRDLGPSPALDSVVVSGIWHHARKHVDAVAKILKKNQNSDGSFSKRWFEKKEKVVKEEERILYTGHALDFLAVALDDKQIREDWVRRAANAAADAIIYNRYDLDGKNWAVAHAVHALRTYSDRLGNIGKLPPELRQESESKPCCD